MHTTTITLNTPIKRGESEIARITLHKPKAGQLRGVSLREALEMNTDAIVTVIPRISDPQLTAQEMQQVDTPDLLTMGAALANFLLPPQLVAEAAAQISNSQTE